MLMLATTVLFGAAASPAAAAHHGVMRIEVLSNRADLISGGDALVAVDLPRGTRASSLRVTVGARNVKPAFAARPNGRYEGVVTGLRNGPNTLTARLRHGPGARIVIT